MKKNVKKIFGERLTKLIHTKYEKKIGFYRDFEQKLDNKNITGKADKSFNVIESGKKWTNGETIPDNLEILISLANFFNVSIDYLLGNAENPADYTKEYIHNYTGLSYDAINTLSILKEFNKDYDQYRKPAELEALNFIMKDSEKFREFIGYISALFIGADKAFYRDKEDKKWRFISDSIHVTYPTSKNSNGKQTANTDIINIKSLAETDCIRHIELILENWKQEFKKMEM